MVELEEIAAVPHHIITARHAKPIIGIYQDTLVGSYLLTRPGIQFSQREYMNLMMYNKRFDGTIPVGRALLGDQVRWSGQQVLGALLPPINMELGNKAYGDNKIDENLVKIIQGDITQGTVDGDIYMKPSKGIVHITYNDFGPKDTVDLLDSLQSTVESFLVLNGFSVGISDLIADEDTKKNIDVTIQDKKKKVEEFILQVHMDLFDNNTGKTNQQEFEDQIFGILNQATADAGNLGQQSLSTENRLLAMVRSGSKGEPLNVAQMMACLGQTAIEGKRVPYGFTDRTLPHYKKYDDSSEARGFIDSSFIRGLTPQQFFFHAMSGREGLIDTAVKSVTADTEIVILEDGQTKWTTIGSWIDGHLATAHPDDIEHHETANMELLNLTNEVYIPTTDMDGKMSWGKMTAITRHDPGDVLYKITTKGGKDVIVTAGKSLLIWDTTAHVLKQVYTSDVKVGDFVPVTMNLPSAPITATHVDMSLFFPKTEYIHGTDFHIAKDAMALAQGEKFHIPRGWWEKSNGTSFTLPYPSKARFQRVLSGRSKVEHIQPGSIYAYHAERTDVQIPERFELNEENGIFIGLFLADGNADIPSGYVQITKNDEGVRTFVKNWFTKMGMKYKESSRDMTLSTVDGTVSNGTSTEVRGFSRLVAQFLTAFVGHGSEHKHVPDIAFTAPLEFVKGILNGYISGDGYVLKNGIGMSSVSKRMMDGMAMLLSRIGVFAYQSVIQHKKNNIGTTHILPSHTLTIRSLWANHLKNVCSLIHSEKQLKLAEMTTSTTHINYDYHNDIVLDTITEITEVSTELYPKMYDVTVPSTLNFAIANGINLADTADTGYIQRQLIKSMEDLTVQHDGTVRDANGNVVQFYYGEDGINPIKIETQSLSIGKLSEEQIRTTYGMKDADWSTLLDEGITIDAAARDKLVTRYVQDVLNDQYMLVERVLQKKALDSGSIFAPVNLARYIHNIKVRCGLDASKKTNLTQQIVLEGIYRLITRTRTSNRDRYEMCQVCAESHGATNKCLDCPHGKNEMCDVAAAEHCTKEGFERHRVVSLYEYHKIWAALLRFHLAPHMLIKEHRFTKEAFEMLMELILVNHMKAWVQPGDQVGIVAAQSIGEPATQMSSQKDSLIVLQNDKNLKYFGTVGEICDRILEENKDSVVTIGKDSVVLSLKDNYFIVGVSEDEKTSWKRISEISRHPANGGLVEVVTRSGRRTTATLTHSFLKRSTTGIVPVLGSDLKIGMRIPIARHVPEVPQPIMSVIQGDTIFDMDNEFGWVCGIYLADGSFNGNNVRITKIHPIVEERLSAFAAQYAMKFTTHHYQGKFGPGKDNNIYSKDLKNFLLATFGTGSYEKHIGATAFHANKEFIAGLIGGYFDGDGNVSVERQLIRASSRSKKLIENMTALLGYVGLFGTMSEEASVRIKDKVQHTLVILPKFAQDFKDKVGFRLSEKAEALDEIIAYNAREDVHAKPEAVDKIPELGAIIAQTGKLLQMPGQSRTYGRWAKKESIGRQTLEKYVMAFKEKLQSYDLKDPIHDAVKDNMAILKSAVDADVVWDEIVELIYHDDPKEFVYDFTVPGNDSFMVDCNVLVHNTLNSVDWDTEIMIAKNGKILTPKIGEWIDQYYQEMLATKKECIQYHPNNQIFIPLQDGNDWKAISCDEDGNMKWTKLEAITRHPVINEDGTNTILKVTLESGREVKATKGKSFLTLQHGKVLEINGSDLSVGDSLPIANHLALTEVGLITKVQLRDILPATEYLYGSDVHTAMEVMTTSSERHWFKKNQGVLFTLPYSRSDAFRDAFQHGHNSNDIRVENVYNKHMKQNVSQIPETIDLTCEFGFFCGAYLAEGMSNNTQVMITNNDAEYLKRVKTLMDAWNVGTHIVSTQKTIEKSGIKGLSTSLVIHSTILAKVMKTWFGRISYEKNIPNWALQAPDAFLKGLMDGYICGDGTVDKRSGTVHATSVSKQLIEGIQRILARFHVYSTMTSRIPKQGKFDSVSQNYMLTIPKKYSNVFASTFTLMIGYKQETLNKHHMHREQDKMVSKWKTTNDVVWDKIKAIEEVAPMGEGWMYDITVEDTRNFMTNTLVALKDTFHQAGVASKSAVTRGVPRLRELLKVTQNPKATSLTIYLKPEFRNNKEKAREVVQDLELTLLHTITNKVAIYWDDTDKSTIIDEDRQLMDFYSQFQNGPFNIADDTNTQSLSKWVLRLELNHEEMFNRNITMQEVVFIINYECGDSSIIYSDYNSDKLIMRIRLPNKSGPEADKDTASTMDDLTNLKKFQNKLLNSIVIRGVPGIKDVTFRNDKQSVEIVDGKYQQVEQFVLDTNGSNFIKVMNHPMVDGTRVYSTNVWDVFEVLGIEATRATLFNEINGLFDSVGVNYRHLCLLCDVMTRSGQLMSIDRYGINKNDIGTLAKASFEETEKILLKAALFGEVDPVTGVSANIMMGQPIRGGTAFSQILLDDQMLVELLKNINIHEESNDEEELDIDFLRDASADVIGPCSRTQFHTSMILPEPKAAMDEPDVELTILDD